MRHNELVRKAKLAQNTAEAKRQKERLLRQQRDTDDEDDEELDGKESTSFRSSRPSRRQGADKRRHSTMARTFDAEEEEELHSIFKGLKNGTGDNPNETTSSVYTGSNGITTVRVSVYLPFLQRDLFRELVRKSRPLDVDEESAANVEVVRPGRDRHMPTASEGYIRRTEYKNGIVMRHELVEVEIPSRLKWRILEIKRVPISLKVHACPCRPAALPWIRLPPCLPLGTAGDLSVISRAHRTCHVAVPLLTPTLTLSL